MLLTTVGLCSCLDSSPALHLPWLQPSLQLGSHSWDILGFPWCIFSWSLSFGFRWEFSSVSEVCSGSIVDAFWGLTVLIKESIFLDGLAGVGRFKVEPSWLTSLLSLSLDLFKSMFLRGYWPEIFSEGRMLPANDRSWALLPFSPSVSVIVSLVYRLSFVRRYRRRLSILVAPFFPLYLNSWMRNLLFGKG